MQFLPLSSISTPLSASPAQVGDTASTYTEPRRPAAPARPSGPSRALKLGKKSRDTDSFVEQLQSEGEQVAPRAPAGVPAAAPAVPVSSEPVSLLVSEKLTLVAPRDGGLQNMELHGQMTLRITDERLARLQVQVR